MTVAQSDIEAVLLRGLTANEETYVERLTEMAEAQIESLLPGFSVDTGTVEDEVIPYNDPTVMWTARYPVDEITSLSIDGTEAVSTSYRWNEKGRIELGRWVSTDDFEINLSGFAPWSQITTSYAYGLAPLPANVAHDIAVAIAEHFRRAVENPGNVQTKSLGSFSVTHFPAPSGFTGGLTPLASTLVKRWSRTSQVSVPLVRR